MRTYKLFRRGNIYVICLLVLFNGLYARQASHPPRFVLPLDTLVFDEDVPYHMSITDWYDHIEDPNHPDSLLDWKFTPHHDIRIKYFPETDSVVFLPRENWHGLTHARVFVRDPLGAKTHTVLAIIINSINDPPFFRQALPDTFFYEDKELRLPLAEYVKDKDHTRRELLWDVELLSENSFHNRQLQDSLLIFTFLPSEYTDNQTPGATISSNISVKDTLRVLIHRKKFAALIRSSANYFANDMQLRFTLADKGGGSASDTLGLDIIPKNDRPKFSRSRFEIAFDEDKHFQRAVADFYKFIKDPDNPDSSLVWGLRGQGEISAKFNRAKDSLFISAPPNWYGSGQYHLIAKDPGGLKDTTLLDITVRSVNDAPKILTDSLPVGFLNENYRHKIEVVDIENDTVSLSLVENNHWVEISEDNYLQGFFTAPYPQMNSLTLQIKAKDSSPDSSIKSLELPVQQYFIKRFELLDFSYDYIGISWDINIPPENGRISYLDSQKNTVENVPINSASGSTIIDQLSENTFYSFDLLVDPDSNHGKRKAGGWTTVKSWSSSFPNSDRLLPTEGSYKLMSIPYLTDNPQERLFSKLTGIEAYDDREIRIITIDEKNTYRELDSEWKFQAMLPGFSYIITSLDKKEFDAGPGHSFENQDTIRLDLNATNEQASWVLLANPFNRPIEFRTLLNEDLLAQQQHFIFNNKWEIAQNEILLPLQPFVAYLKQRKDVYLLNDRVDPLAKKVQNPESKNSWNVQIQFSNRTLPEKSFQLLAGAHQSATAARDFYDILAPPRWQQGNNYGFLNPEFPDGNFIGDFRSTDQMLYEYEFFFNSNDTLKYIFNIKEENLPVHLEMLIIDLKNQTYFLPHEVNTTYANIHLKLVIATSEQLEAIKSFYNPVPPSDFFSNNYPNPFNGHTSIDYQLPTYSRVNISIYDVLGRKVRTLLRNRTQIGNHYLSWDGLDDSNTAVASGIYFLLIESDYGAISRKLTLTK